MQATVSTPWTGTWAYEPDLPVGTDVTSGYVFDVLKRQVARVGITLEPVRVTWPEMQKVLKSNWK